MTVYVVTNARGLALGGRKWHIARYKPTGYGVHALCGQVWNEGEYRTHGPGIAGPLCKTCRRIEAAA